MKKRFLVPLLFLSQLLHAADAPSVSPEVALRKLKAGNQRYASGRAIHPDQSVTRRETVAKGQHPFAVVLDCADSRLAPEIIFDQGLGSLFVVRVAGNLLNDEILGSIEYAVDHLGASTILVLGHEHCGAVEAAVKGGKAPGHIGRLIDAIAPAVKVAKKQQGDLLDNAVKENARQVAQKLRTSKPLLAHLLEEKQGKVVAGYYNLDSGRVTLLE